MKAESYNFELFIWKNN